MCWRALSSGLWRNNAKTHTLRNNVRCYCRKIRYTGVLPMLRLGLNMDRISRTLSAIKAISTCICTTHPDPVLPEFVHPSDIDR